MPTAARPEPGSGLGWISTIPDALTKPWTTKRQWPYGAPAHTRSKRRPELWICRFAWTTQTRCPHTNSRAETTEESGLRLFEEEERGKSRRLCTLIPIVHGPTNGVHFSSDRGTSNPGFPNCGAATGSMVRFRRSYIRV